MNGPLRVIPGSHQKRISDDAEFPALDTAEVGRITSPRAGCWQ
ncbi:MAG: hypothetical protein IPM25_20215 [Chloracidobacterium sp.]|nr:hypothetical protein [Chloracidobacterium sp.]